MKIVNVKRYLGTLAAAATLSVASLGVQAATVSTIGTITDASFLGGAFGIVVGAESQWGIDTTAAAGNLGVADIDAARFVVYSGLEGSSIVLPMVFNSNIQAASLTWDGTDITGGTITFDAEAGTGQKALIDIDYDAGTFDIYSGDVISAGAYGAGGTINAVPVPAAAWLFGSALVGLVGVGRKRRAMA